MYALAQRMMEFIMYSKTMKITFEECQKTGYAARTWINASADLTLAIGKDFHTAGEKLTAKAVL
jgi:hypothetical protein